MWANQIGASIKKNTSVLVATMPWVPGWTTIWRRYPGPLPMQRRPKYLLFYAVLLPLSVILSRGSSERVRTIQTMFDGHDSNREVLENVALGACFARCEKAKSFDCWNSCLHNHTLGNYYWAPEPHAKFNHKPEVQLGPEGRYIFRWSDALNQSHELWQSVVYGVFWASDTQDWTCLYLNTSHECELDANMLVQRHRPRLLVNAMSRDGVIAEETLLPVLPVQNDISRGERLPEESLVRVTITQKGDTLKVCVNWPHAAGRERQYTVHWARLSCQSNPLYPGCDEPTEHWAKTLTAAGANQNITQGYCLPWKSITFNSRYWVQVDHGNEEGERQEFSTPTCKFPDRRSFTKCYNSSTPQNRHMHEVLRPWYINYTCLAVHARTGEALVNLSWHLPRSYNTSRITYIIRTLTVNTFHSNSTSKQLGVSSATTKEPFLDVTLKPHSDYTFTATASVKHRGGGTLTFVSRQLVINTTTVQRSHSNETCEEFEVPVVGLLVPATSVRWYLLVTFVAVGGAVIVTSGILLVLRRFSRLRFTIRMTSLRANSNSYKSSPELGDSLENELMCLQDGWEINPSQVQICTELGRGAFGRVMTGLYNGVKVAIKILKEDAPPSYKEDLLQEIALMKDLGQHPNIVLLIGACTQREPTALILEYMPYGNLQSFLTHGADEMSVVYAVIDEDGEVEQWTIAPADLLSFARQVTKAMEFLGDRQIVHRDLAARNVLLGFNKHVKVSDFGLARAVSEPGDAYHKLTAGKLPLKWMAVESLQDRVFTTASDVWSFGVLLWELVTTGASPYPGIALADLYILLASGYRMERPRNCSDSLYDLMLRCWREEPSERPSFTELRLALEEMLAKDTNYLDLENIDIRVHQSESSSFDTSPTHQQAAPQVVPAILHVAESRDL